MDDYFFEKEPLAVFNGKAFRYPFWLCIIAITQMGLAAMFVTIFVGAPIILSMLALFLALLVGIGWLSGNATYTLSSQGIRQEIKPFSYLKFGRGTTTRNFAWSEIKSYQSGSDINRSLKAYNFLYISVSKMPYQLRLSDDQANKDSLLHFVTIFEQIIQTPATTSRAALSKIKVALGSSSAICFEPPKRKPSFYERPLAHLVFWVLAIGFGGLVWFTLFQGQLKATNLFRFWLVIIPGLGYMAYRLYGKK